ncbi:hypothetical protein F5Y10DRAFT_116775 [Nemania abortiva]|nr:hypothetical protein F5Y10DRAFT_116775 [Nemania abortiva]
MHSIAHLGFLFFFSCSYLSPTDHAFALHYSAPCLQASVLHRVVSSIGHPPTLSIHPLPHAIKTCNEINEAEIKPYQMNIHTQKR